MILRKICLFVAGAALSGTVAATGASIPGASLPQGGVARWEGLAAKECGIFGKRYAAVDAICYYPVDLDASPGRHEVALWDQDGKRHLGFVQVEERTILEEAITLPLDRLRFVEVSPADSTRARKEELEVKQVLAGKGGVAQFSLPLGAPASPLTKGPDDFGSIRTFNGLRRSLHTGRDFPVGQGSAAKAVADGTVVLAGDQFFSGNSVYVDHGGGLVSMTFHLSSLAVKTGDTVKRGDTLGPVGDSGRTTGPHLHLGVRWQGQRIDPSFLLVDPGKLPSIGAVKGPEKAPAAKKGAKRTDKPLDDDEG